MLCFFSYFFLLIIFCFSFVGPLSPFFLCLFGICLCVCLFPCLFLLPHHSFLVCLLFHWFRLPSFVCSLFFPCLFILHRTSDLNSFFLCLILVCSLFLVYFSSIRPFGVPRPQIPSFFVSLFFVHSFFVCPSRIFSPSYVPCLVFVYSSSIVSSKFVFSPIPVLPLLSTQSFLFSRLVYSHVPFPSSLLLYLFVPFPSHLVYNPLFLCSLSFLFSSVFYIPLFPLLLAFFVHLFIPLFSFLLILWYLFIPLFQFLLIFWYLFIFPRPLFSTYLFPLLAFPSYFLLVLVYFLICFSFRLRPIPSSSSRPGYGTETSVVLWHARY